MELKRGWRLEKATQAERELLSSALFDLVADANCGEPNRDAPLSHVVGDFFQGLLSQRLNDLLLMSLKSVRAARSKELPSASLASQVVLSPSATHPIARSVGGPSPPFAPFAPREDERPV